ncbi:MAG: PEP-CTERM sorting domain-containing protein [Gammaproteobacteria bacterium]
MKSFIKYAAPLALLASGNAHAVIIDLFDDPPGGQSVSDFNHDNMVPTPTNIFDGTGVFSEVGSFASILGGHRDLYVEKDIGVFQDDDRARLAVAGGALSWSNDAGVQSVASVQWDGDDDSPLLNAVNGLGVGGVDLSGDNAFRYTILESDIGFTFILGAYSSPTVFTTIALTAAPVLAGSPVTETIPFFFFSNPIFCGAANVQCGADDSSPVDFSAVTALEVIFLSAGISNIDLQIDMADTVPEPTSLALIGASLLAAGGVSRRRAKKA